MHICGSKKFKMLYCECADLSKTNSQSVLLLIMLMIFQPGPVRHSPTLLTHAASIFRHWL